MNIRTYYIFTVFIFSFFSLTAQKIEFQEYKLPTDNNLIEVEFFNKYNGIIVSDSAEIFYTSDGGRIWIKSKFNLKFEPKSLIFSNNGEAIIIGSNKTIIKSIDYGETWLTISYSDTSKIIYNNIVTRSPYEIYITDVDAKNITYTIDGLQTLNVIDLSKVGSSFRTHPILYNKYDDKIYCAGKSFFDFVSNNNYYTNQGIVVTNYFDTILTTPNYTVSLSQNTGPYDNTIQLFTINTQVLRFDGRTIRPLSGDDEGSYSVASYYSNDALANRLFVKNDEDIIIADVTGNICFLKGFNTFNLNYVRAEFDFDKVNVTDTILYDYFQIKENKGIVTSVNGKYFMYDNSGVIDSAHTNDSTDTIPDLNNDSTDVIKNEDVGIYPNPTFDKVSMLFDKSIYIQSIELFELTGYSVFFTEPKKELSSYIIDISNLQSGNYFLKIITEERVIYKKIVKF